MSSVRDTRGLTVRDIQAKKGSEKIVVVTAYDVLSAKLVDQAGVDVVLVGDSAGNVIAGYDSTIPMTLDNMIYHGAAVKRGVKRALVVVDMPFLTYQTDVSSAVRNAGTILQKTGAATVKVEGGSPRIAEAIAAMVDSGIPVMAHLGLTPQSVNTLGGNRVQGRDDISAQRLIEDAKRVEAAGAFSVVLELMPAQLAKRVTEAIGIPTIGIGAGVDCDGQVLVLPDMLGMNEGFAPKFLKKYANLAEDIRGAVGKYAEEVRGGVYPGEEHSFS